MKITIDYTDFGLEAAFANAILDYSCFPKTGDELEEGTLPSQHKFLKQFAAVEINARWPAIFEAASVGFIDEAARHLLGIGGQCWKNMRGSQFPLTWTKNPDFWHCGAWRS
jgi:hypothetical protein